MYSILLATPCYGGNLKDGFFTSVIKLKDLCTTYNIKLDVVTISSESLITRARNYYVAKMLSDQEYTHLLFIDSDITFKAEAVIRMILANKDIMCGLYPKKGLNWNKIVPYCVKNQESLNVKLMEENTLDYCVNLDPSSSTLQIVNNLIKVKYAGTGFMMIKRTVLEKMAEEYPETKYVNDVPGYETKENKECFYALFDTIIDPESKRYLSEDFTFCDRWTKIGGEIYADINIELGHTGSYTFNGNFVKSLNISTDV
jgi:uncharacterized protein YerC